MCQICNWEAQSWGSARPTEGRGRCAPPQREAGGRFLYRPPRGLSPPCPDYAALVRLPLWALVPNALLHEPAGRASTAPAGVRMAHTALQALRMMHQMLSAWCR
jgi:hypothetical protein